LAWSLPQTPLGELTALPRPPSWVLGGPTSKGREGGEEGRTRRGREGVKREEKGRGWTKSVREEEGKGDEAPSPLKSLDNF